MNRAEPSDRTVSGTRFVHHGTRFVDESVLQGGAKKTHAEPYCCKNCNAKLKVIYGRLAILEEAILYDTSRGW